MTQTDASRGEPRDRIMVAAFELVAEEGLGSVTMTAIADRADVARQTLYNHFTDVEQIVIAGMVEYNAIGFAHLMELLGATATTEAKLDLLVRHTVASTRHGHTVADLRNALAEQGRVGRDAELAQVGRLGQEVERAAVLLGGREDGEGRVADAPLRWKADEHPALQPNSGDGG